MYLYEVGGKNGALWLYNREPGGGKQTRMNVVGRRLIVPSICLEFLLPLRKRRARAIDRFRVLSPTFFLILSPLQRGYKNRKYGKCLFLPSYEARHLAGLGGLHVKIR